MTNKHTFLTYNTWNGDLHKGTNIDHRGLSEKEIEDAINLYIIYKDEIFKENLRLKKLTDELLNERNYYKKLYETDFDKINSGY